VSDPIKKVTLTGGKVRWRFVVDVGRDPATGRRRQITKTYDTKREAKAEYDRMRHQAREGTLILPSKQTVSDWLDEWLASATRGVEAATAANYRDAVRPVRERLGDRHLQAVSERDVEDLVDWMLTSGRRRGGRPGTGLSPRAVRLTLGRFKAALDMAARRGLVPRNVAQYVELDRRKAAVAEASRPQRQPWSTIEVRAFLNAIRDERLYPVLALSLMGLRPAEVCGLRWSDIDLEAGTLTVANTRTLVDGKVEEKGPKSEKGKRPLPLPRFVAAALRTFRARQAAERLEAGELYQATAYVVVDELGVPGKTDWLRRRAYGLMKKAGVRQVRLYDARHACLTYLATSGEPDVNVSAWAGHADLSFTKRTYVHPDATHLRPVADRLDAAFGS
jgi:integrase